MKLFSIDAVGAKFYLELLDFGRRRDGSKASPSPSSGYHGYSMVRSLSSGKLYCLRNDLIMAELAG